jgi:hypothetical protein
MSFSIEHALLPGLNSLKWSNAIVKKPEKRNVMSVYAIVKI